MGILRRLTHKVWRAPLGEEPQLRMRSHGSSGWSRTFWGGAGLRRDSAGRARLHPKPPGSMNWSQTFSQTESSKCSLELHTSQVAPAPYWDTANKGLDLTFDKDRRRGTDLEGEGKHLDRPP